ncbi:MAG: Bug family tripartite tricarboxylate transporter substrate binding protein [Shimia sp.]
MMTSTNTMYRVMGAAAFGTVTAFVAATASFADTYPERPITLIVPWGAGGGTDATGRMMASLLEGELGQPVNVVNRTGGSGVVGHSAIANAEPDGYTIGVITVETGMMHWAGLTDLTYEGFTPIALYNSDPAGVIVSAESEWNSLEDMLAAVEASPGTYKGSGTGQGGIWHLALAGMLNSADMDAGAVPWVPSDGSAAGLQELVAGGVDVVTASVAEAAGLIEADRVKALAVMSSDRMGGDFAEIPTLPEAGGPEWQMAAWRGIAAPAGIPEDIQARLEEAVEAAWNSAEFQDFMNGRGFGLTYLDSAAFGDWLAQSDADLGDVMKAVGIAQ